MTNAKTAWLINVDVDSSWVRLLSLGGEGEKQPEDNVTNMQSGNVVHFLRVWFHAQVEVDLNVYCLSVSEAVGRVGVWAPFDSNFFQSRWIGILVKRM